ncbi:MAG: hypothetical protein L0H10_04110 [Comamonas sp.]|uniref:hypothetical protein n=1 Tax=Comamonas sp. TaxID=34028 RepID=UPI0026474433|nr:hypothetical protein [Comamonas sp.]MDN5502990.1 hypothetical protein [Comamonas sp.]MDN5539615.1 hypothetical protein [Comamonas sp.]
MERAELVQLVADLRKGDATAVKAADVIEEMAQLKAPALRHVPVVGEISGEDDVVFIKKLELPPGTTWAE